MSEPLEAKPPAGDVVHRERRFTLRTCDIPLADGSHTRRGVVVHGGSVVLVPITSDGQIVLIRNHRWQVGCTVLELAAGTLEPHETPAECAARELAEETGYTAGHLIPLTPIFALPGLTTEIMYPFIAQALTPVGQSLELDEDITVVTYPPDAVRKMLADGEIRDAKTMAILGRVLLGGFV